MNSKLLKWVWGGILVTAWLTVLVLLWKYGGKLTVEQILNFKPQSVPMAVLAMLGLFLLKSVDFIMNCCILYAADGIMFSLPAAIALNLLGTAVMVTPPYFIGKTLGKPLLEYLTEHYPRIRHIIETTQRNRFFVAFLLRIIALPLLPVSLYMGAAGVRFLPYFTGSVIGLCPLMLASTLLGTGAENLTSPVFLAALVILLCLIVCSLVYYRGYRKKRVHSR